MDCKAQWHAVAFNEEIAHHDGHILTVHTDDGANFTYSVDRAEAIPGGQTVLEAKIAAEKAVGIPHEEEHHKAKSHKAVKAHTDDDEEEHSHKKSHH